MSLGRRNGQQGMQEEPRGRGVGSCGASAPGKVILMGEHAAVYGAPAVVAAIDLRTQVEVSWSTPESERRSEADAVCLDLPNVDASLTVSWSEIDRLRAAAREQSARHMAGGAFVALSDLGALPRAPVATLFVATSIGEVVAAWVAVHGETAVDRLRRCIRTVRVASEAPLGGGCGSSAAVAMAVIAAFDQSLHAIAGLQGTDPSSRLPGTTQALQPEAMALLVERYQHGRPSGVDTAAVARGGVLRIQQQPEGQPLAIEEIDVAAGAMTGFTVAFTGQAPEPTGVVVDAVRRARAHEPKAFDQRFAEMGGLSDRLIKALRGGASEDTVGRLITEGQRHLEALGVVPEAIRAIVRSIEAKGAVAKVSGAGSLSGPGAGVLLVYDPQSKVKWGLLSDQFPQLEPLAAPLGAEGLRLQLT